MRPLDLVPMMVLDNGARWGECATDEQWADMRALLEPDGGPRRHFWLRSRGKSKTFDTGAATIAVMLADPGAGPGVEMYAAAAGKDQAALLAGKILAISRNTPELAGAVEVQQHAVLTARTGAKLDVLSSELATSWGKTPFWLFIDEICNHDNTPQKKDFVNALVTALVKRRDSRCLAASTPSDERHWSYDMWEHAQTSKLWRAVVQAGPASWQDPDELEDEHGRLLEYEWKRLFLCQWASADDILADGEALAQCTRGEEMPQVHEGTEYVVTWDIGWKKDHSAVAVAHMGARGGRKAVIIDRLDAWIPKPGAEVRISEVLAHAAEMSRVYNGALLTGDPHEAWQTVQDLREDGYNVKPADTGAAMNSVRAKLLLRLVRDRAIEIPPDGQLRKEFLSLRLAEGSTPGVVRLTSDGSAKGHFDRVTAILYAAGELLTRPGMSWRDMNGSLVTCYACARAYLRARASCVFCGAPNPDPAPPVPPDRANAGPQPGSWATAWLPPGAVKCAEGHWYRPEAPECPRCAGRHRQGTAVPAAFASALAMIRR